MLVPFSYYKMCNSGYNRVGTCTVFRATGHMAIIKSSFLLVVLQLPRCFLTYIPRLKMSFSLLLPFMKIKRLKLSII